jgi:hypothetical protein
LKLQEKENLPARLPEGMKEVKSGGNFPAPASAELSR